MAALCRQQLDKRLISCCVIHIYIYAFGMLSCKATYIALKAHSLEIKPMTRS